jgi:hypothetical protein
MKKFLASLLVILPACTLLAAKGQHPLDSNQNHPAQTEATAAKPGVLHLSGEVSHGEEFRKAIGRDLFFVLDPLDDGWTISVFPAAQCTREGQDDFVAVATEPFFGSNPRFIDTSGGEQALHSSPREFQFLLDCKSYKRESALVGTATAGNVSENASANAMAKLGTSAMGSGKLTILDSKVVKSGKDEAGNDLLQVDWLKFQVDIVLPGGLKRGVTPTVSNGH